MSAQDPDAYEGPAIRLRVLLVLLRLAAGQRGYASAQWAGGGYRYRLEATRLPTIGAAVEVDADPDTEPGVALRLEDALYPRP